MNSTKSMATGAVACLVALLLSATAVAQSGFGDGSGGLGDGSKKRVPASPGPFGACCLGDGSCLDLPEASCDVLEGMYQGTGTACAGVTCTPFGACCFPDMSCEILTATECGVAGGIYEGNATVCDATICPCPADIDGSGDVGPDDLLDVLSNWGPCPGCPEDIDGSGAVDFQDLLIVLTSWGTCP
jgi:hypothetical protein